jgi:hypothetical protein
MLTTGAAPEEAMPKRARTGGVGKGKGTGASAAAPKSIGRSRVNTAAVAAAVGKDDEAPMPKPKSQPRRNRVSRAGVPVERTIVKKVPLDAGDSEGTLKKKAPKGPKAPRRNTGVAKNIPWHKKHPRNYLLCGF